MNTSFTSNTPLSYNDWIKTLNIYADKSSKAYLDYLNNWYLNNSYIGSSDAKTNTIREQYIQLIKDLSFLFNSNEKDLFLTEIDYTNDEDLIYVIPYFVNKLKQVSQVICEKREELKNNKTKNSLIGSNQAVEKILYSYILKNFTNKDYTYTQIPISTLSNIYPQLSTVNENFYIEVEELYDTQNYHDSDPYLGIFNYENAEILSNTYPFSTLSSDEMTALLASRILPKVTLSPLSTVFKNYLSTLSALNNSNRDFTDLVSKYTAHVDNLYAHNQTFLGENIYGLSALTVGQANIPDYNLSLTFQQGNNWFYWPYGSAVINDSAIGNTYKPININDSVFLYNRQVSGVDEKNADLLFTEKNGVIEGAWLQGMRLLPVSGHMYVKLWSGEKRGFIYPYVGYEIDSKSFNFSGYTINDSNRLLFETLDPTIRVNILSAYYTAKLPSSTVNSFYINKMNLIDSGANAGEFSDIADTIKIAPSANFSLVWHDASQGFESQAFLYKFTKTDLPVSVGVNNYLWPITQYTAGVTNVPITINENTCLPINVGEINIGDEMIGAIAGNTFSTSDVIYKLNDSNSQVIDAAWLGAGNVSQLDIFKNAIQVYQTSAINCAQFIDGPIQPSLSLKIDPGNFVSFIWMGEDTYANDVFNFKQHALSCPFAQTAPHDFYKNQDYQNPKPLDNGDVFPLNKYPCTCRSVYYSPIGTEGKLVTNYNSMGDLLFADPQGLGQDFSYGSWFDTRNFDPYSSPQFAFYQIDGSFDNDIGFGKGKWVTGDGQRMVLKTGRRYTYFRSALRNGNANNNVNLPYLLVNYVYPNINVNCAAGTVNDIDLVLIIDKSRTENYVVGDSRNVAAQFIQKSLASNPGARIALISFDNTALMMDYLTRNESSLLTHISQIKTSTQYPDFLTNIQDALTLAQNILFNTVPVDNICNTADLTSLCKNLNQQVINYSDISTLSNCPRTNATKRILIFSDGQETVNIGGALPVAESLKQQGVIITSMDIGYYADDNSLMETIASKNQYHNLQDYLLYSDVNLNTYLEVLVAELMGCFPTIPMWCKAQRDSNGNWTGLHEPSNLIIRPNDYVIYVHRSGIPYTAGSTAPASTSFTQNAVSFTINVNLDGWDYSTSTFSTTSVGDIFGARPFWGKINTSNNSNIFSVGGQVYYYDDYVPVHQPEISDMVLNNGCYLEYTNRGKYFIWNEDLTFNVSLSDQRWNKLIISKEYSNLSFALNNGNTEDIYIKASNEPSDITFESYSGFQPAKYNYVVRNSDFAVTQPLYYINRCNETFVYLLTSVETVAVNYYKNILNVHYPTIATINLPYNLMSEKETGKYLLPDRLGAGLYFSRGYTMDLDTQNLSYYDSISAERLYLNPSKYSGRHRGLTKKDQISPVKITDIDNRWMYEPYSSNNFAGVITDTIYNQKFVPYMATFEYDVKKQIGIAKQSDDFNFWTVDAYQQWTNEANYPLTFRKELLIEEYFNRLDALLTEKGSMNQWRCDIYGNEYGLLKDYNSPNTWHIKSERGINFMDENHIPFSVEK